MGTGLWLPAAQSLAAGVAEPKCDKAPPPPLMWIAAVSLATPRPVKGNLSWAETPLVVGNMWGTSGRGSHLKVVGGQALLSFPMLSSPCSARKQWGFVGNVSPPIASSTGRATEIAKLLESVHTNWRPYRLFLEFPID